MVRKAVVMVIALAVIGTTMAVAQQRGRGGQGSGGSGSEDLGMTQILADIPTAEVSQAEIDGLLLMREEEKLARDVYTTLAELWNMNVFSNIARSEQTHMDAIGQLLERYDIDDPIKSDAVGDFTDSTLDSLYDGLVDQGSESLADALKVGALIEDLDIADLERLMGETDNDDIKVVYQNLTKGSRNHLRSFYSQIERNGRTYDAKYISSADLTKIVTSSRETGQAITDPSFRF